MTGLLFDTGSRAIFSPDRRYRYHLARCWGDSTNRVAFVGLNPSKADEVDDDMTIRKCRGFAQRWGFGALDMVNLYGLVSTDPRGLLDADDPVGPDNARIIEGVLGAATRVVLAWGDVPKGLSVPLLPCGPATTLATPYCFGRTSKGSPRHPSRLAYSTPLEPAS